MVALTGIIMRVFSKKLIVLTLLAILLLSTLACGGGEETVTPSLAADSDGDGWTDAEEQSAGTDPYSVDTDGDGYWDPSGQPCTFPVGRTFASPLGLGEAPAVA